MRIDWNTLPPDLQELSQTVTDPRAGFFGPHSLAWNILRENTLQLVGPATVLMQIAHPHVAQGVAEHSQYKTDPIGRLKRTFIAVHNIAFGTLDDALEAALATRRVHARVQGVLPVDAGPFSKGSRYHANRPDLLLWVHATLVNGAIQGHETFIRRLSDAEKRGLYEELKIFARLFGVPAKDLPTTYADFLAYYEAMIEKTLAVTDQARDIAHSLLRGVREYRLASPLMYLLASAMLPERVRAGFRLPWNRAMQLAFDEFVKRYRQARLIAPPQLLYRGAYLKGMRRTRSRVPSRFQLMRSSSWA